MKRLNFIFFILLLSISLFAQGKEKKSKRNTEVGLNITNTLAGFFNSGGSGLSTDPYLFSLKFSGPKGALRFGTNFTTQSGTDLLDSGGTRKVDETNAVVRGGYEFRKPIDNRFTIYYGVDAIAEYQFEKGVRSEFNREKITTEETIFGFGGGPVLGIQYQLMDRIAFSTEASIYGIVNSEQERFIEGNNTPTEDTTSVGFKIAPFIPSSLYLIMIF